MVSKLETGKRRWLFPKSFQMIVDTQLPDGQWEEYASEADGILNTLASLLSLCRHRTQCQETLNPPDILTRISKAVAWLDQKLSKWHVAASDQVGFELIAPSIIILLKQEGVYLYEPPLLFQMYSSKLQSFKLSQLSGKKQSTALHSLEAFDGQLDFSTIAHHKRYGSLLGSPSSTAAYLMNIPIWDDESEHYLQTVMSEGAGHDSGGFPSAFPSINFELIWVRQLLSWNMNDWLTCA